MGNEILSKHLQSEIAASQQDVENSKLEKNRLLHERKLSLLTSLQNYVEGKPSREDAIVADVINDMLQALGLLESHQTFRDI
ncbi:hypothetical protein D3C81_1627160 [compost metagenome]